MSCGDSPGMVIVASAAPVIRAVVDSGPTDSWGEDPMRKYTARATKAAQSPASGGTPAKPE